jgi:hypothetical protein
VRAESLRRRPTRTDKKAISAPRLELRQAAMHETVASKAQIIDSPTHCATHGPELVAPDASCFVSSCDRACWPAFDSPRSAVCSRDVLFISIKGRLPA